MLELDLALPPGALCDDPAGALASALADIDMAWWSADGLQADPRTGAVTAWAPRLGTCQAIPTDPNTGHGQIGRTGSVTGLQCKEGIHCGMVAPNAASEAGTATLGLRYMPPRDGDARTLLTFNTGGAARKSAGENYVYVAEAEGQLTVMDDKDLVALTLPVADTETPRTVLISLRRDALNLVILGGATAQTEARAPVLSGPANLFIGCRNQRPKLLKTLGAALIADVWLWPGRDLLGADEAEDKAILTALRCFHLWSEAR